MATPEAVVLTPLCTGCWRPLADGVPVVLIRVNWMDVREYDVPYCTECAECAAAQQPRQEIEQLPLWEDNA